MKTKLQEIIKTKIRILSEKKTKDGDVMNVSVPCIKSDVKNKNGRIYKKSLLQREIARVQDSIKKGSFIGAGDHPQSGISDIATASHIVTSLSLDEKGQGWADLRILPTQRGKTIQTLIRNNATLGVSFRGFGQIGKDGTVQSDYQLVGVDIVTSPSDPTAHFDLSNVYESVGFEEENEDTKDKEEAMYGILEASYGKALEQGFQGDFDFYCQLHEPGLRKVMLLPEDKRTPTKKIAEAEQAVKDRTYGYFLEAQAGGFIGSFDEWKEKYPRLVEQASEGIKISEQKTEIKEPFKSKATWEEIQLSGWRGTMAEYEEKFPDISIIRSEPPQKPITETLEQEASRIFYGLKKQNPNSSTTLESVRDMLLKEEEPKRERKIRETAILRVYRDLDGSVNQATIEKMVEMEIKFLKEQREEKKRKNWEAYRRLLD